VIVAYTELPGEAGGSPRPLLDLVVGDTAEFRVPCLVDSGALHTLLPAWVADASATSLAEVQGRQLRVAGMATEAMLVPVRLTAASHTWESEVGFCHPWPYAWGLLGQLSFFRFFTVIFRAVDFEFEVEPI
jgi:hypothetical protein